MRNERRPRLTDPLDARRGVRSSRKPAPVLYERRSGSFGTPARAAQRVGGKGEKTARRGSTSGISTSTRSPPWGIMGVSRSSKRVPARKRPGVADFGACGPTGRPPGPPRGARRGAGVGKGLGTVAARRPTAVVRRPERVGRDEAPLGAAGDDGLDAGRHGGRSRALGGVGAAIGLTGDFRSPGTFWDRQRTAAGARRSADQFDPGGSGGAIGEVLCGL